MRIVMNRDFRAKPNLAKDGVAAMFCSTKRLSSNVPCSHSKDLWTLVSKRLSWQVAAFDRRLGTPYSTLTPVMLPMGLASGRRFLCG